MAQTEILVRRGQLVAVLAANAVLWVAAIIVIGNPLMGGPAAIALIAIGSILRAAQKLLISGALARPTRRCSSLRVIPLALRLPAKGGLCVPISVNSVRNTPVLSWLPLLPVSWSLLAGRWSLFRVGLGLLFSVNSVLLSLLALSASAKGDLCVKRPFVGWVSLLPVSWSLVAVSVPCGSWVALLCELCAPISVTSVGATSLSSWVLSTPGLLITGRWSLFFSPGPLLAPLPHALSASLLNAGPYFIFSSICRSLAPCIAVICASAFNPEYACSSKCPIYASVAARRVEMRFAASASKSLVSAWLISAWVRSPFAGLTSRLYRSSSRALARLCIVP